MKRCMGRRKPFSISRVFMNPKVDLAWGGRFTMKRMEGMKGGMNGFSMAQLNSSGSRRVLI